MTRLLILLFLLGAASALADGDWEAARRAVEANRALPLSQIAPAIEQRFGARLIEAEFDSEDGVFVYELKLITERGRMMEVMIDAASGEVLAVEQDGESGGED